MFVRSFIPHLFALRYALSHNKSLKLLWEVLYSNCAVKAGCLACVLIGVAVRK